MFDENLCEVFQTFCFQRVVCGMSSDVGDVQANDPVTLKEEVEDLYLTGKPAADFGARNGQTIDNIATVLKEVDDLLTGKPPAIEYVRSEKDGLLLCLNLLQKLFVCPFRNVEFLGIGFGSPYGHAAVRYTLKNGEQVVMNIVKNANGNQLVNLLDPTEYLYGTRFGEVGAEQGGTLKNPTKLLNTKLVSF